MAAEGRRTGNSGLACIEQDKATDPVTGRAVSAGLVSFVQPGVVHLSQEAVVSVRTRRL